MAINVPLNAQLQNATQLQQQIQNAVNSVRINLGGQNGARALSSLSQPLGRLTGQADEFTKSLDAANARVLAFGASVGVVNAVTNAFKSLVNSTIEVEKAITAISVVGDQFTGKTKELSQGLFSIAKATGQSFSEVSKAALEFSRQGLNLEDTLSRTQDALVLTRLTGLDAAKSVDGLTAAVNAFSKAGLSTTQIINKLAAVDQAFAVSSADLIEGFNRSAAVAQNAGVTFDELAGIITALQQETSRGGAVIGNALKTIFTRLQDTSTLNQLQNLGIAVQDLQGNILPARQILQNLATDIEGLGQITKAGIFKDVAGTFQINQLISLVGDLNKENSVSAAATRKAASATNEAFIANEKLNQSLDAVLGKVANTGKQLGSILGELGLTDNLKGLLDGINSFLEGASSLLQGDDLGSNFAKGFVKGIGAVLSGPGLGIFLAIIGKLSLDLAKFGAQSLKAFFGIGKAAADQKLVQESIVQTLLKNQNVLNSILNTQGGQNAQALKFLGLLNQQAAAMQAIQGLAGGIASTVYAGGYRATAGGLQRKAAGGYLPTQEASDVRRGVGGASPSSKVVAIPNFAFGGGKRGTMIANTSEYIVPNYAGGGSAIFNQDMVKTMGLPAGAKKISAAGGFVPNSSQTNKLKAGRDLESRIFNFFGLPPAGNRNLDFPEGVLTGVSSQLKNQIGLKGSFGDLKLTNSQDNQTSLLGRLIQEFDLFDELNKSLYKKKNAQNVDLNSLNPKIKKSSLFFQGDPNIFEPKEISASWAAIRKANKDKPNFLSKIDSIIYRSDGRLKSGAIGSKVSANILIDGVSDPQNIASGGYIPNFSETNKDLAVLGLYGNNNGNINGSPVYTLQGQSANLTKNIEKEYQVRIKSFVRSYSQELANQIGVKRTPREVIKALQQTSQVSGFIFEDVLNQLAGPEFDSNRISGGARADFPLTPNLRKVFGATGAQKYAEVKLDPYTTDSVNSIKAKQAALAAGAFAPQSIPKDEFDKLRSRAISLGIGQGGRIDTKTQSQRNAFIKELIGAGIIKSGYGTSADQTKAIKKALGIASGGYIPNFAAAALQQAIAREKSAGLSDSQIYIDQNAALKSPMNPMGLMVANRRDEPAGGFQGISRARKEGMNPKLYGAANGFVPNYAVQAPIGQIAAIKGVLAQDKVDAFNKALEDTAKQLKSNQISLSQAEQNIEIYAQTVGTSARGEKILESEGKKLIQAYDAESKARKQKAEELRKQRSDKKNISEPPKDVNKGFADAAGKIFLLQSALSFLTGAVGDSESSFAKLTQQVGSTIGNLTSLGLLGQQIAQTNPAGNFGKLAKNIGLVGIAAAGIYEGLKGTVSFVNEYSGANDQAIKSVLKFDSALSDLAIKIENFSPITQKTLEIRGKEAIKNIELPRQLFETDLNQNPEFIKQIGKVAATGASTEDIQKIISDVAAKNLNPEFFKFNINDTVDALYLELAKAAKVNSDKVNPLLLSIKNLKAEDLVPQNINKLIVSNLGESALANQNLLDIINDTVNIRQKELQISVQQQDAQNKINFGERLSLEIAKQRLDRVFALKKINEESLTSQEQSLQYELETLDLSNKQKIIKESELKNLELERKKRLDILAATEEVVNKASQGGLSVNVGDLDKLTEFLKGNLGKIGNSELSKQIQDTFKIGKDQADNLIKSLQEQTVSIEDSTKAQKDLNNEQTTFKLRIDNTNQSLQDQLSTFQRIAQTAQSVASLNISFGNLDIGKNEAEINRLQALASNPNLNIGQKESIDKQVISLQKINNETKKRNELESFQAKQAELSSQILKERASLEKTTDQTKRQELNNNIDALIRQTKETENNYKASTLAIDANNLSLSVQEQQIGKVIGAYSSLNNQLLTFRRGAGERIGGAMFEQLGATDINSLMQARIKQNIETEAQTKNFTNDQDYYKFIQEQTRLRQIQFDLATAESATRKRELEYELKYTQEIIDLKKQGASDQELIDARNRQILEQRSGRRGFEKGLDTIQERIDNYRSTLGEEIPNLFSSNLAQGLNDAISGAKSLKEALTDAATSFFQEITRKNISNLADLVTGGLGKGASSGGGIFSGILSFFGGGNKTAVTTAASGGMIKGGSGTKDDVPAMLMGGEYVMKKSAVNKYGKGFLDALNNGKMRGYATGGLVDPQTFPTQTGRNGFFTPGDYGQGAISGKNQLLTFASQSFTGGQYDYMGGFGMGGASVGLESESARLSAFGRENSPMFERVQQSKDEAFKVYLEGLQKEKEYAELLDQIAQNEKARKKQLQTAIISAVVSSALSYAGTRGKTGAKNSIAGAAASAGEAGLSSWQKLKTGTSGFFKGIFTSSGGKLTDAAKDYFKSKTLEKNLDILSENDLEKMGLNKFGTDGSYNPYYSNKSGAELLLPSADFQPTRRASGGLISGGSNIRDDVPTMLTGGEFVLNNRATQRIGLQNLNKLNNGQSVGGEGASAEMTQALISKLDELIQATQNSSSENVVVNVSSNETGGQNQENPAGAEKELHKKIRQAVLDVIAQEKRLGGSLEKSR